MPAINPIATRPAGPIQLLSNANFRKYATPIRMAKTPTRFSQYLPIFSSRLPLRAVEGAGEARTLGRHNGAVRIGGGDCGGAGGGAVAEGVGGACGAAPVSMVPVGA